MIDKVAGEAASVKPIAEVTLSVRLVVAVVLPDVPVTSKIPPEVYGPAEADPPTVKAYFPLGTVFAIVNVPSAVRGPL